MNQNYYPIDFEAQYEDTSEKMIEISKKYKEAILNGHPDPVNKIQEDLEDILNVIEGSELTFRKQPIYSQFASGQLMAERRKQQPEMCPGCGEEMKKIVQCEFCAELYCRKCCYRNRVIPFVSKEVRLCCETCHWKFVKLFDNAYFYEEKEKLVNVVNFVRNKVNKISQKIEEKKNQVEDAKNAKRNDKIKEKNLEKKIQDEEKHVIKLQEDLRRVVALKAEEIKEAERRQQQQREQQELQRIRALQLQREEEIRKQKQTEKEAIEKEEAEKQMQKIKDEEEKGQQQVKQKMKAIQAAREQQRKKEQELINRRKQEEQQQQIQESIRKKFEEQLRKKNEELQELKRQVQSQSNEKKSQIQLSSEDSKSEPRQEVEENTESPKQQMSSETAKNQKLVKTEATSKSNNQKSVKSIQQIEDRSPNEKYLQQSKEEAIPLSIPKYASEEKIVQSPTKPEKPVYEDSKLQESDDPLERSLAKMLKLNSREEQNQSVSNVSRTSKNVMDMSVKELLGMRIPVPTSSQRNERVENLPGQRNSKQNLQEQMSEEQPRSPLSIHQTPQRKTLDRNSFKRVETIQDDQLSKQQLKMDRNSLIQNSSLLSSTNKEVSQPLHYDQVEGKKCQCQIM